MNKKTRGRALKNTGLYLFVAIVFLSLSLGTKLTFGDFRNFLPYLPENLKPLRVSMIFIPAVGGLTFIYIAGLFRFVFEGRLNRLLIGSFYSAGIVGFFAFYLMMNNTTFMSGLLIIGGFGVFIIYSVFSTLSDAWHIYFVKILAKSAAIFILGQIFIRLLEVIIIPSGELMTIDQFFALKEIFFWGFIAASILTLFGVLKGSDNSYLSSIGSINSSAAFTLGISIIGSLYYSFLRGNLTEVSPVMSNLSPYIEWTGIVLVAGIIFTVMRRGMSRSMMAPALVETWMRHIQDTNPIKGEKLTEFTTIINNFLEGGEKEKTLVRLFNYLKQNRVSEDEMQLVLSELIKYEDKSPPVFSLIGRKEAIDRTNKKVRIQVLERTVRRINSLDLIDKEASSRVSQGSAGEFNEGVGGV